MFPNDQRIGRVIHQSGLIKALGIVETRQHQIAVEQVVDRTGSILHSAAQPLLTPLVLRWGPSDTGRWPLARAGKIVLLRAFAETPPSTGRATITLTMVTAYEGEVTLGMCNITQGQQIGEIAIGAEAPAGAWLRAMVTVANGASGVSTAVTVKPL